MFGKRGDRLEERVSTTPDTEFLRKKVEALQQKVLTSEKLQQQVFDFMAEFEKRVNEIVDKKLQSKPQPGLDEKQLEQRLSSFEETLKLKINEALTKLNTEIEQNKESIEQLKELAESFKVKTPSEMEARVEELQKVVEGVINQASQLQSMVENAVANANKALKSTKSAKPEKEMPQDKDFPEVLNKFEVEITSKLNRALNGIHKEIDSIKLTIHDLEEGLKSILHAKPKHGGKEMPHVEDLKSFKLTINQKIRELANEIDYITSELASHDYVAILETEFRRKIEQLNSRVNALEVAGYKGSEMQGEVGIVERVKQMEERLQSEINKQREALEQTKRELKRMIAKGHTFGGLFKTPKPGLEKLEKEIARINKVLERVSKDDKIRPLRNELIVHKKELNQLKDEIYALLGKTVKLDQLNSLRKYLKDINKKADVLDKNLNRITSALDKLPKGIGKGEGKDKALAKIEQELKALGNELSSFEKYCVEQIDKTNKWIRFINENLK